MLKTCCIKSCKNTSSSDGGCFYRLPREQKELHAWLIALYEHTGQSTFKESDEICYKHFSIDCFLIRNGVMNLKATAVPFSESLVETLSKKMKRDKPIFRISCHTPNDMDIPVQCSVIACSNVQKDTNQLKSNIIYHPFPKNNYLAQNWKSFCNKVDNDFENSYICSEHFMPDDFVNLAGNILKNNATPSIYKSDIKIEESEILYPNKTVASNSTLSIEDSNKMEIKAQCSVFTCSNVQWDTNPLKSNIIYYPFPSTSDLAQKWKSFCNRDGDSFEHSYICSEHFVPDDFVNLAGTMLKKTATPSVYKKEIKEEEPEVLNPNKLVAFNPSYQIEAPVMVTTSATTVRDSIKKMDVMVQCSVFTCSNIQSDINKLKPHITYYPFPKNRDLAEKWKCFCSKIDDDFDHSYICSEHFTPEDFVDLAGSILKKTAIPSIYENDINREEPKIVYVPVLVATSSNNLVADSNKFSDEKYFKRGKALKGQTREVVLRIFKLMKERFEKLRKSNVTTLALLETVELTGVSSTTVKRIIAESKRSTKLVSPSRQVSHPKPTTGLNCEQLATIKQIVYDFHKTEEFLVTNSRLTARVNEDLDLTLSESSMKRILLSMGFNYKRAQDKRKFLCEREDIRFLRIDYITKVREFRTREYDIVYILYWSDGVNEGLKPNVFEGNKLIICHAGSSKGLVRNALLIFNSMMKSGDSYVDMNFENFSNWLKYQVLFYLDGPSVIVIDNALFQNQFEKSDITSECTKDEMKEWLKTNNIQFDKDMFKIELYDLIKRHRPPSKHLVDDMIRSYGHEVLRLPSCNSDLNPIEKIWSTTRRRFVSTNTPIKLDDLKQLGKELEKNTPDIWKSVYESTIDAEDDYMVYEVLLDNITNKLAISTSHDSSTSESNSSSDDEESVF